MDASLGYEKNQKGDVPTANKRNGHSPKTLKSQYGEFRIDVPRDREAVYNAPNETSALSELEKVKEKWGKKYPYAVSNWESNWEDVSSFFQFSDDIRRIMYTTNIIEGLNRQYRKVTKTKSVFPSDSSLEKMLYLASGNVVKNGRSAIGTGIRY